MQRYIVNLSKNFEKKFKKLVKGNNTIKVEVIKSLKYLSTDPFYNSLRTHKVNHRLHGHVYSSRITGDIRIIWNFNEEKIMEILALDIGGHNDVYR